VRATHPKILKKTASKATPTTTTQNKQNNDEKK